MPFAIPGIDRAHFLDHQDTGLDIGNWPVLHALGHLEHVAYFQLHSMIDTKLLRVFG